MGPRDRRQRVKRDAASDCRSINIRAGNVVAIMVSIYGYLEVNRILFPLMQLQWTSAVCDNLCLLRLVTVESSPSLPMLAAAEPPGQGSSLAA